VLLHFLEFILREPGRLVQDIATDIELADVVQQGGRERTSSTR